MTKLQKIKEEIVPLSRRESLVLGIIVACVFQFALFYAPALADEAVEQARAAETATSGQSGDDIITSSPLLKTLNPDRSVAQLIKPLIANTTPATTSLATPLAPSFDSFFSPAAKDNEPESATTEESTPTITVVKTSVHVITAYNSEAAQTDASPCITANGYNVCESGVEDTIAANFLKFGTKVQIPELFGDRIFVVRDRMNKRHADRVDVWMKDRDDAIHFGVKTAKIQVIEMVN
jgi:3D (Asp-Asp-Asp) domain-containing protein